MPQSSSVKTIRSSVPSNGDRETCLEFPLTRKSRDISRCAAASYKHMPTGHTARDRLFWDNQSIYIEVARNVDYRDGCSIIPVTIIDFHRRRRRRQPVNEGVSLVTDGDITYLKSIKNYRCFPRKDWCGCLETDPADILSEYSIEMGSFQLGKRFTRKLKKQDSWEVEAALQQLAVQSRKVTDRENRSREIFEYDIPIIGHVQTRVASGRQVQADEIRHLNYASDGNTGDDYGRFCPDRCRCYKCRSAKSKVERHMRLAFPQRSKEITYNGVRYELDWHILHTRTGRGTYRPVSRWSFPDLPEGVSMLPAVTKSPRSKAGLKIQHALISRNGPMRGDSYWLPPEGKTERPTDCLIADLGREREVTHVSTMGQSVEVYRSCLSSKCTLPCSCTNFIWVIKGSIPNNFVTRYKLFGRREGGRSWIFLGTFNGNSDCVSEVVNPIASTFKNPSMFRFLKFVPTVYQGAKALRVGIYGPSTTISYEDDNDSKKDKNKTHKKKDRSVLHEVVKTLTYRLNRPHSKNYVLKCKTRRRGSWNEDVTKDPRNMRVWNRKQAENSENREFL